MYWNNPNKNIASKQEKIEDKTKNLFRILLVTRVYKLIVCKLALL